MTIEIFAISAFCLWLLIVMIYFCIQDEVDLLTDMYRKNGLDKDEAMRAAKSHVDDLENGQ